jgi:hypothetical protein
MIRYFLPLLLLVVVTGLEGIILRLLLLQAVLEAAELVMKLAPQEQQEIHHLHHHHKEVQAAMERGRYRRIMLLAVAVELVPLAEITIIMQAVRVEMVQHRLSLDRQ